MGISSANDTFVYKGPNGEYREAVGTFPAGSSSLPAGTDRSGSITTGGTAQDVAPANTSRVGLSFQNTSDTVMRVTENGVTATATTGYAVYPASATTTGAINISTNNRISVFCATTGKTFAATEY